jgi:hypothetical protein
MTPRFFFAYVEGVTQREQAAWQRARFVSFWAVQKPEAWKINKMTDIAQFEWEKKEPTTFDFSEAEQRRLDEIAAEFFAENS